MSALTTRASSPRNDRHTTRLEFERCSGCQPAQTVFFHAHYDSGDGLGPRDRVLGSATPDPTHPRKFYADWWFAAAPPQDAEFFAEMVTPDGQHFFTDRRPIRLNRETTAPTGTIVAPAADSHHRGVIRFQAQVTDAQSGVDRVEYFLTTAANPRIDVTPAGRPAQNYVVDWSSAAVPEGLVSVCAEAFDLQGNHTPLPCVPNVRIDRTPPTVVALLPAPINQPATWLTSNTAVLRATVSDVGGGIREVRFTGWYRDAANVYGPHLLGTGTALSTGEFRYTWNLAGVPDQADRGQHQLYVDITAEDRAGNAAFDTGWLAGIDRARPTVQITQPAPIVRVRGGSLAIAVTAGDNLGPAGAADRLVVSARYRDPNAASATDHTLANIGPASSWTGSLNLNPLAEQILNVTATATDASGQTATVSHQVTLDRTGPTFSGVSTSPQPFVSGGPRTMSFSYVASEPAAVTIAVSDPTGAIVRKIQTSVGTNPTVTVWDGRDDGGQFLPTGPYTYALSGLDGAGNVGPVLNIRYTQNEPCRTEVEVLSGSTVIRYLGALQSSAGKYNVTWDGRNGAGVRVAAPANYTIRVRAVDAAGLATVVTATIPVQP